MGLDMDFSKLEPQDVLDLAIYAEEDARDAYDQIASWMDAHDNREPADFFRRMARAEQAHCDRLNRQRRQLFGDTPPRHTSTIAWEVEAPDYDAIEAVMSLRAAFKAALSAEVKAYDYYDQALAYVTEPTVVELFEQLRQAELDHQRMIERELAKVE